MAKYDVTFACGHFGVVNIIGPVKDRAWKRQNEESKMCPDCWRKSLEEERERKNREAAERAAEMELPELTGTPKQVEWANVLRQNVIEMFDEFSKKFDKYPESDEKREAIEKTNKVKFFIIENKTTAKYYIDNRSDTLAQMFDREKDEALKSGSEIAKEEAEKEFEKEAKIEATVYPRETGTNSVVEIGYTEKEITAITEKNETFRKLVRDIGFRWDNGKWSRSLSYKTGRPEDRVAELGNKLLNTGFPIRIYDETVRKNAIEGNFEVEHKRWIGQLKGKDRFAISWSDGKNWYNDAKSLPGSKWERPFVTISVEHFKEVEEFAELYDFRFSPGAKEMIEQHMKAMQKANIVEPVEIEEEELKDGLQKILESSSDVLDDLKD